MTTIVVKERGQGKTQALVRWFLDDPNSRAVVLLNDSARREFVRRLEESDPEVFHHVPFLRHRVVPRGGLRHLGLHVAEVGVDDVDVQSAHLDEFWNITFVTTSDTALLDSLWCRHASA
jgi:hypothetical protein